MQKMMLKKLQVYEICSFKVRLYGSRTRKLDGRLTTTRIVDRPISTSFITETY